MPQTITIPSTTRYLREVRRFVEAHAQASGFSTDIVEQLKLAVDEACSNVINHAYADNENGEVQLAISVDTDKFTVIIRDRGTMFDREKYMEPDLRRSIAKRQGGGYGVFIMRHLMDDVSYRKRGKFNEVRLTKRRPPPPSTDPSNGLA